MEYVSLKQLLLLVLITYTQSYIDYNMHNHRRNTFPWTLLPKHERLILSHNYFTGFDPNLFTGLTKVFYVSVAYNRLTSFPDFGDMNATLTDVILSNNQISTIDGDLLDQLQRLENLNLRSNKLTAIPDVSGPAETLTTLDIGYNLFATFPTINHLAHNVTTLVVDGNQIVEVDVEAFRNMSKLENLNMKSNKLTTFPNITLVSGSLHTILFGVNSISQVTYDDLKTLTILTMLELNNNKLTEMPSFQYVGEETTKLNFAVNKISLSQATDFMALNKTNWLSFQQNYELTTFPNLTYVGQTLNYLYLKYCRITYIPYDVLQSLKVLKTIDLHDNRLIKMPTFEYVGQAITTLNFARSSFDSSEAINFKALDQLISLDFRYNRQLTKFPNISYVGDTLQTLMLRHCGVTFIPYDVLQTLKVIKNMDLHDNRLLKMPTFEYVGQAITSLNFAYSQINFTQAIDFKSLDKLTWLSFERNTRLTTFPNLTYIGDTLTHLYVQYCRITYIPSEVLESLTVIKVFWAHDNRFIKMPSFQYAGHDLASLYFTYSEINITDPNDFKSLDKLTLLSFEGSELAIFPNLTYVADTLTTLHLHRCKITYIPYELLDILRLLTTINLYDNKLHKMPPFQNVGQGVTQLDLQKNQINITESADFMGLTKLNRLSFSNNFELSSFPNLTYVAGTLLYLNLDYCQLEYIPNSLLEILRVLTEIRLHKNRFTEIPSFQNAGPKITYHQFSENQIKHIAADDFLGLQSVQNIVIYRNILETFPNLTHVGSTLKNIDLRWNQIRFISAELLGVLTVIENIYLEYNKLTELPDHRLVHDRLKIISYIGNPINYIPYHYLTFKKLIHHLTIRLYYTKFRTVPPVHVNGRITLDIRRSLVCDNQLHWAPGNPNVILYHLLSCSEPPNLRGQRIQYLDKEKLLGSSIKLGQLVDEVKLHDGKVETCTQIIPVKERYITPCSPFPPQLILQLVGAFTRLTYEKLRVIVVYTGALCTKEDILVYGTVFGEPSSCVNPERKRNHWRVRMCPVISSQILANNQTECQFKCDKSDSMYITFRETNIPSTLCDVTYEYIMNTN